MTVDLRLQTLRAAVTELIAFEGDLEARLEREREVVRAYPEALAALERFRPTVHAQRDRLVSYLEGIGGAEAGAAIQGGLPFNPAAGVSAALRGVCVAFHHGAISYAMLYEMALRLHEPALREIAPEHLEVYVDAASTLYRLLPAAVAWELAQDGLQCSCICPMCGLGVCGCVSFGTQFLVETWREALAAESALPGFALQPPKPDAGPPAGFGSLACTPLRKGRGDRSAPAAQAGELIQQNLREVIEMLLEDGEPVFESEFVDVRGRPAHAGGIPGTSVVDATHQYVEGRTMNTKLTLRTTTASATTRTRWRTRLRTLPASVPSSRATAATSRKRPSRYSIRTNCLRQSPQERPERHSGRLSQPWHRRWAST